jgi:hypothetical protein
MGLQDAASMKDLADESLVLYNASVATYHQLNLDMWEIATGAQPMDANVVMKNLTTYWGTVARDIGNLTMLFQQVARVAAPPTAAAPDPAGSGSPPKK